MTGYCKTCGDTLCIGHEVAIDYKSKYLNLRELAQAYLDAEKNLQEVEEDEWADMYSKHDEAQTALREALKNE